MNCDTARRQIGADPNGSTAELELHVQGCSDCAGYRREMRALELQIGRALDLPMPGPTHDDARARVLAFPAPAARERALGPAGRRRLWAFAASLICAVAVGVLLVTGGNSAALAADVVAHMAEEPDSWSQQRPVPQSALDLVLRRAGVRLDRSAVGDVVYAQACWFRDRYVPHLVVRTKGGPVTVLVLAGESARGVEHFAEGGYTGVIAPAPSGAVAVLGRGEIDVDEPLRRVQRALAPPEGSR